MLTSALKGQGNKQHKCQWAVHHYFTQMGLEVCVLK